MKHYILFALVSWAVPVASARSIPAAIPEVEKISKLMVGSWTGDLFIQEGKHKEQKLTSKLKCTTVADGAGVYCVFTMNPPSTTGPELFLVGYDKKDNFVHFFELEGASAHDHVGKWSEDGALVVTPMASEANACSLKEMRVKRVSQNELNVDARETNENGEVAVYRIRLKKKH